MKENIKENLYFVENVLRVIKKEGALYGLVKWENWNYKNLTYEPLETLKLINGVKDECEKREEEFLIGNSIRQVHSRIDKQVKALQEKLFGEVKQPSSQSIKDQEDEASESKLQRDKKDKELEQEKINYCMHKARNIMRRRIAYNLDNLTPSDYFKLKELHFDAKEASRKKRQRQGLIKEEAVEDITGILPFQGDYKFAVTVSGKKFLCESKKMLEICPVKLYNYLCSFLRYMMGAMSQEINRKEEEIRTHRDKHKPFEQATKMLNVYHRVHAYKYGIHFGLDHQDTIQNMEMQVKYFRGLDEQAVTGRHDSSDGGSSGSKQKKNAKKKNLPAQLTKLYQEVYKDLNGGRNDSSNSKSKQSKSVSRSKEDIPILKHTATQQNIPRAPRRGRSSSSGRSGGVSPINLISGSGEQIDSKSKESRKRVKKTKVTKSRNQSKRKTISISKEERQGSSGRVSRNQSSIQESKSSGVLRRSNRISQKHQQSSKRFRKNND